MATKKQFSMDGLIEQMLDGLFRMAEKVTRTPYKPHPRPLIPEQGSPTRSLSKGRGEWNEPGTEEGTLPAIAKSDERKVPVRKRRRQRVKMVEGTLFE